MAIDYGKFAAHIHKAMCDDAGFGYSQQHRWGENGDGYLEGVYEGVPWKVRRGDYDCSSSVIAAWKAALSATTSARMLDGAGYTGNIEAVFVASGLFETRPMSFLAAPGDLYLKPGSHVAMCQTQTPDVLSEFSINENGGITGGRAGDQTGREAWAHPYYSFADRIIHYRGGAKAASNAASGAVPASGGPTATNGKTAAQSGAQPRYRAYAAGHGWLDEMEGLRDTGGSGDDFAGVMGSPVLYLAVSGVGRYRVRTRKNGWLPWVDRYDTGDLEYGCAGDGSEITGIEIPNSLIRHAAHDLGGGWNADMVGSKDTGGSADTFAGSGAAIDAVRIRLA